MYTNQITCVPGDYYVALLRREGHEVHVFEKSNRRIVVIKLQCPYSKEAVYNSYDSELEKKKLFCPKILTQREVE
ncbi:MAG: hypothetical protein LBQ23_03645, partial [Puniceicoccales bacterium]|nr:hypothetical protein [Puniceicoccales bacterium]